MGNQIITKKQKRILNRSKNILQGEEILVFPNSFCKGFSERCIETPWVAHQLRGVQKILDIGFTFASAEYLGLLLELKDKYGVHLKAVDIIMPEKVMGRYPKEWLNSIIEVPVILGNIMTLDLPNEYFDAVTIISTIEHIGFDEPAKTVKGSSFERMTHPDEVSLKRDPNTNSAVLDNLSKVLKKNGKILLSVPMGKGGAVILRDSLGFYTAQWEYDERSWREIIEHERFTLLEERFFKFTHAGWTEVFSPNDLNEQSSYLRPHAEGIALCVLIKN